MDIGDLIKKAKAGDSIAWRLLYERHYPWLSALALNHCRSLDDAQDAVQETFVSAFLKLHQLKDPVAFPGWLKAILVRHCLRTLHSNDSVNILKKQVPSHWHCEIAEQADEEFSKTKLHNVLAMLPEVLRGTLLLRYFSDWNSYEQMAEILNVPVGTVRSRLNQAKAKLSQHWSNVAPEGAGRSYADEWNEFYTHHFSNLYFSLSCRDSFLDHLSKSLVLYRAGSVVSGRHWIEQEIEGDLHHGSFFKDVNVVGSGNISIVEVATRNSSEHPDRCPAKSVIVLFRDSHKVERLHLHSSS